MWTLLSTESPITSVSMVTLCCWYYVLKISCQYQWLWHFNITINDNIIIMPNSMYDCRQVMFIPVSIVCCSTSYKNYISNQHNSLKWSTIRQLHPFNTSSWISNVTIYTKARHMPSPLKKCQLPNFPDLIDHTQ